MWNLERLTITLYGGQQKRYGSKEQTLELVGEGKSGNSMETYTLPYVKEMASGNLLYDSGNSNWAL